MSFLRRKPKSQRPEPEELYKELRKHVLKSVPGNFSEELREAPILALLWENGFAAGVGSLLGSVDGHVAMYLSNGGGTMGNWTSPALTEANTSWLETGATFLRQLQVTPDPPLPGDGVTQFVAVTPTGVRSASAPVGELDEGRHPFSPFHFAALTVFYALDELTTAAKGS
jgi:hypothetical protein